MLHILSALFDPKLQILKKKIGQTNKRTNEQRTNEQFNHWTNEQINKWKIEQTTDQTEP